MGAATVVRPGTPGDAEACVEIVEGLPQYFTPNVAAQVARDMAVHHSWVAEIDDAVVGFAVVSRRFPVAVEVLWAAVDAAHRGQGVGTVLITALRVDLHEAGVQLVEVKTLDPSADYEPYRATYGFWSARGFHQIDTIAPPTGWDPGSPAAILVASLG